MEKKIQRHPFRSRTARRRGGQAVPARPTRALTPAQREHLEALDALCGRPEELLPRLSRDLGIPDLAERVDAFQRRPAPDGINIKGKKRTTLKLFIPNLLFSQPIEMGENVWIYTGELNPAYCLFSPWAENTQVGQ